MLVTPLRFRANHTSTTLYLILNHYTEEHLKASFSENNCMQESYNVVEGFIRKASQDEEIGYLLGGLSSSQYNKLQDTIYNEVIRFILGHESNLKMKDKSTKLWRTLVVDHDIMDEHLDCINDELKRLGGEVTWSCAGHTSGKHARKDKTYRNPYFNASLPSAKILSKKLANVHNTRIDLTGKDLSVACTLENTNKNKAAIQIWWNDICKALKEA